jgi:hypothetical protein
MTIKIRNWSDGKDENDQYQQCRKRKKKWGSKSPMDPITKINHIKIFNEKMKKRNDDQNHAWKRCQRDMTIKISTGDDEKEKTIKNNNEEGDK